jgi:hypothetical protein
LPPKADRYRSSVSQTIDDTARSAQIINILQVQMASASVSDVRNLAQGVDLRERIRLFEVV